MHLYKPGTLGTYKPTLFSLTINKRNVLNDKGQIKDEYGNTFFHEYIHFLQDVLTSFGLRNIAKLAREYSVINHEIIALDQPYFTIPYQPNDSTLALEKDIFRLIWGTPQLDNDNLDFEVINIELEEYTANPQLNDFFLVSINIIYRDSLERDAFYLGALHFMENMAYLLERKFSLTEENIPYPYKVIEKITNAIFHDGIISDKNLILIMEAALETHNPAQFYFDFHQFCMRNNERFDELTITDFRAQHRLRYRNRQYTSNNFYYANAVHARNGLNAFFTHERLKPLNQWAKKVMENAIKIKRSGFSFTDLLVINQDFEKVQKVVARLIKRLGTPVMSDSSYGIFLTTPDDKAFAEWMVYLLGFEAVLNVLNGEASCSISSYCKNGKQGTDITDLNCFSSPWERTKQKPLCIFAELWIMWGFVRKDVQKTNVP